MEKRRLATVLLLVLSSQVIAQEGPEDSAATPSPFSYGMNGLQFESADGDNFLWFGVRLQPRSYSPWNPDIRSMVQNAATVPMA